MTEKAPNVIEVEAVLVDDDGHPVDENLFERVTRQGAETLDALGDSANFISEETAAQLHTGAAAVRGASKAVMSAVDSGKKFVGSAGEVVEKLGLKDRFVMVSRPRERNTRT